AGVRVTGVTHEDPAAIARAQAARAEAQDAQVRALSERVAELERSASGPPPMTFVEPASSYPSSPQPQYTVSLMPSAPPEDVAPAYGCAWVGCALPWGPAIYAAPYFASRGFRGHDRNFRRSHGSASPHGFAAPRGTVVQRPTTPARPVRRG